MKVILASKNQHKLVELSAILSQLGFEIALESEYGLDIDVDETGTTFEENSFLKAEAVMKASGLPVLADDSGLEIDYLGGEPGIYSARYMGEDTSYDIKNARILERMEGVPDDQRTARFVCAMAAIMPGGEVICTEGIMEGLIGYEMKGTNGFGYDPIFYLPEYGMTSSEISPEKKNEISHRGKALRKMQDELKKRI